MFVLEYFKKKNFLNRNRNKKVILKADITDEEELNILKFKEEISSEILKESEEDE